MPEDTKPTFPKKFLWGASTSGHQVEGGNHDQWTVWELAHAAELAKTAKRRLSHLPSWERIKDVAEKPETYISGRAVDHYNLYKEDIAIAKKLNLNSLRFTVEWSRIEPQEGVWDSQAIEHYRDYIAELKKSGIEPVLNIWHWTMPVWFTDKGAFKYGKNIKYFERFVQKISDEYARDLKWVITLNEPNVYTAFGYLTKEPTSGNWPPGESSPLSYARVTWNLISAHRRAYKIIKGVNPSVNISLATQLANIQAKRPHNELDEFTTKVMRYFWNWLFLRRVRRQMDFIGFNYYFTDYYTGFGKRKRLPLPKITSSGARFASASKCSIDSVSNEATPHAVTVPCHGTITLFRNSVPLTMMPSGPCREIAFWPSMRSACNFMIVRLCRRNDDAPAPT